MILLSFFFCNIQMFWYKFKSSWQFRATFLHLEIPSRHHEQMTVCLSDAFRLAYNVKRRMSHIWITLKVVNYSPEQMLILGSIGEARDATKQLTFIWSVLCTHTKSQDRFRLPRARFIIIFKTCTHMQGWLTDDSGKIYQKRNWESIYWKDIKEDEKSCCNVWNQYQTERFKYFRNPWDFQ